MSFILWSDKFSINVEIVDNQHRRLFELCSRLNDLIVTGSERESTEKGLYELLDYTKYHFSTEENLMEEHEYPYFDYHKSLHEELTRKVVNFLTGVIEGQPIDAAGILKFLYDWLTEHIMNKDKKIGHYIETKIIRR